MSRGLDCERRENPLGVQPPGLVDDIFIAALEPVVFHPEILLQKTGQPVGGDRIGDHRSAWVFVCEDRCHHGDDRIPVDLRTVVQDRGHPVNIGIKDDPEVGAALERCLPHRLHRLLILRVGDVIGERPVRVQIAAAGGVRPERFQHLLDKKAARPVARVNRDFQPCQRMRIILRLDPVADFFAQACGIEGEQIDRFDPFQRCLCGVQPSGILEQGGDISVLQPSVCIEKFQAVAVEREMAGGNHNRPVTSGLGEEDRHKH